MTLGTPRNKVEDLQESFQEESQFLENDKILKKSMTFDKHNLDDQNHKIEDKFGRNGEEVGFEPPEEFKEHADKKVHKNKYFDSGDIMMGPKGSL